MDLSAEILEDKTQHQPPQHSLPNKKAHIYFQPENSIQWYEAPFLFMMGFATLLLGTFIWNLPLSPADQQLIQALGKAPLLQLGADYIKQNGLHNPLGYLFSLGLSSIAMVSVPVAHLILFLFHVCTSLLVGLLFARWYTRVESALFALLFLTFPFISSTYSNLSSSYFVLGLFFIMFQIWVIQSEHIDYLVKVAVVIVLQTVGILVDSRMIITIIPLLIALVPHEHRLFSSHHLRSSIALLLPTILLLLTRWFTGTPLTFAQDTVLALLQPTTLFQTAGPTSVTFWQSSILAGLQALLRYPLSILFLFCLAGTAIFEYVTFFQSRMSRRQESISPLSSFLWFGLACATAVTGSEPLTGFPLLCLLIGLAILIESISKRLNVVLLGILTTITTLVTIAFLTGFPAVIMKDAHLPEVASPVLISPFYLPNRSDGGIVKYHSGNNLIVEPELI